MGRLCKKCIALLTHAVFLFSTNESQLEQTTNEKKKMPDFLRRQLNPPKPLPAFKPQVYWLHVSKFVLVSLFKNADNLIKYNIEDTEFVSFFSLGI